MTGPEIKMLAPTEAISAMESVNIDIPDGYTLVGMESARPALTGAPSFVGSFESPAPNTAQVLLDGAVPAFDTATCSTLTPGTRMRWEEFGLDCSMSDIRYARTSRTEVPTMEAKLLTGTTRSGQGRIFVYWAGT